jgi:hypothetical protein
MDVGYADPAEICSAAVPKRAKRRDIAVAATCQIAIKS